MYKISSASWHGRIALLESNQIDELPVSSVFAIKIVDPVTDAVLLVEGSTSPAHVRNTTSIFVTHVK